MPSPSLSSAAGNSGSGDGTGVSPPSLGVVGTGDAAGRGAAAGRGRKGAGGEATAADLGARLQDDARVVAGGDVAAAPARAEDVHAGDKDEDARDHEDRGEHGCGPQLALADDGDEVADSDVSGSHVE